MKQPCNMCCEVSLHWAQRFGCKRGSARHAVTITKKLSRFFSPVFDLIKLLVLLCFCFVSVGFLLMPGKKRQLVADENLSSLSAGLRYHHRDRSAGLVLGLHEHHRHRERGQHER